MAGTTREASFSASLHHRLRRSYRLQFGVEADNPLNHVNLGLPIGVLSSPYFRAHRLR